MLQHVQMFLLVVFISLATRVQLECDVLVSYWDLWLDVGKWNFNVILV